MTPDFHRFPHTPHLAWLGEGAPRADKLLSNAAASAFLDQEVIAEEKIDGANLGLSTSEDGELLAQNRGGWLSPDSGHPQFRSLWTWLSSRREVLIDALWPDLVLFGEWCVAVHSVPYDTLPDWFLGFDVLDRRNGSFWSTRRRNELFEQLGLHSVPFLGRGHFDVTDLVNLMTTSRVGTSPMEGVYVRKESATVLKSRAKLVRPEFVQNIDTHWSQAPLRRNHLAPSVWR